MQLSTLLTSYVFHFTWITEMLIITGSGNMTTYIIVPSHPRWNAGLVCNITLSLCQCNPPPLRNREYCWPLPQETRWTFAEEAINTIGWSCSLDTRSHTCAHITGISWRYNTQIHNIQLFVEAILCWHTLADRGWLVTGERAALSSCGAIVWCTSAESE